MDTLDTVLVGLAQLGPNSAIKLLWARYGSLVMRVAVSQSRKRQSDFGLNGESNRRREMSLGGKYYLLFADAILEYDESRGVPLEAYLVQKVKWSVLQEKRRNSVCSRIEVPVDDPEFWNSEAMIDVNSRFDNEVEQRRLLDSIAREVAGSPKLTRFLEHCREVFNIYDKREETEVAKRMGCGRSTVYTLYGKVREQVKK